MDRNLFAVAGLLVEAEGAGEVLRGAFPALVHDPEIVVGNGIPFVAVHTQALSVLQAVSVEIARLGLDEGDAKFYPEGGIQWWAETDKMGVHSISPLSGPARDELERYTARSPRIGAVPVFPSPTDPDAPIRKDRAGTWLRKAEKLADLPPLTGGRFHPFRRLFAIELKAPPVHDVAAAGGWSSVETVQRIYQKSEAKGVLAAIQRVGQGG